MASIPIEQAWWGRLILRGGTLCLLATALWSLVGAAEAIILTSIVATVWFVTSTVYAFAVGQLLVVVLLGAAVDEPLLTAGAFGVLFIVGFLIQWPRSTAIPAIGAFLLAWAGLASAWLVESLWGGVAAMLVAFGLLAYGIHRYELVSLGLVQEADA